jgi:hypothetical protein
VKDTEAEAEDMDETDASTGTIMYNDDLCYDQDEQDQETRKENRRKIWREKLTRPVGAWADDCETEQEPQKPKPDKNRTKKKTKKGDRRTKKDEKRRNTNTTPPLQTLEGRRGQRGKAETRKMKTATAEETGDESSEGMDDFEDSDPFAFHYHPDPRPTDRQTKTKTKTKKKTKKKDGFRTTPRRAMRTNRKKKVKGSSWRSKKKRRPTR